MNVRINGPGSPQPQPPGRDAGRATVQQGEHNIGHVAKRLGVDEQALRAANPHYEEGRVNPGQELRIPDQRAEARPVKEGGMAATHSRPATEQPARQAERAEEIGTTRSAREGEAASASEPAAGRYTSVEDKLVGLELRRNRLSKGAAPGADAGRAEGRAQEKADPIADPGPARQVERAEFNMGKTTQATPTGSRRPESRGTGASEADRAEGRVAERGDREAGAAEADRAEGRAGEPGDRAEWVDEPAAKEQDEPARRATGKGRPGHNSVHHRGDQRGSDA